MPAMPIDGDGDAAQDHGPLVAFRDVCKTYDGASLAVAGLDLEIRRGEFVTFLGPSGSGKTTSLLMLAGFEEPTAGDIVLAGRSVRRIPPHRRNIGMVFQNYALFPHMTVAENIAFPLSVRRLPRADVDRKVARALELVRLGAYGSRRPTQLSGGQQQRVALARALVFDPDLVLMDEPLGALDKQLREQLQLEIRHIHADLGVTVVYVTHDQSEALTLSDRIVVFDKGRVQQVGSPAAIYEHPTSSFVARFIGESNRLEGRVVELRHPYCLVETSAGRIRARAVRVDGVGAATTVCIRPERISLLRGDGAAFDNRIRATVAELIYCGDHVRARMRIGADADFILRAAAGADLGIGTEHELGWQTDHCLALDSQAAA